MSENAEKISAAESHERANSSSNVEECEESIDTVHNDEALKIIMRYSGPQSWTAEEEKHLVRRIDRRLMTILCVTFGLQYYDKQMLSQAALFGLISDLELQVGTRYSMSASIFYFGFIAGCYPTVLLAQRYPIQRVIFALVFLWGLCLMATAGVTNHQGLYVQRFFLGALESGVSPTWMFVVGGWYKKSEQSLRMGIWYSCAAFVSMFSPLVNYGLGHIAGSLAPWRYMYIVAGVFTVLYAFVTLFFMDPDPVHAKHLNEREKFIAVSRMRSNNTGVRNTHFKKSQVWELAKDLKFWTMFLMVTCLFVANGPLSTFVPIFIRQLGFSSVNSLLLLMPAGFIIGCAVLIASWYAGRIQSGKTHIITICLCPTLVAICILWQLPQSAVGAKLFGIMILGIYNGGYGIMMAIQMANTAGYTKRTFSSAGIFVGYCIGNIIGPLVFKTSEAPHYNTGWAVVVATTALAMILSQAYRLLCIRENKKRDALGGAEGFEHAYEDDMTDGKNPQFRYTK